jgi:uncharacterized protein (DUF302 family)
MIPYGFKKSVGKTVESVIELLTVELQKEGFGVLTKIPMHEKFKDKLGIDFKKYFIIGACNPPNAYQAVLAEEDIGLLLPCNIVVYEKDGATTLSVIKPTVAMQNTGNSRLVDVAKEVEASLLRVFNAVS